MRTDPRAAEQFVEVVRESLRARLESVSLSLVDLALRETEGAIITPGVEQFVLVGWVVRPATGEKANFFTRLGAQFHQTSPEDVDPLCADLVMKMVEHFYGARAREGADGGGNDEGRVS